MGAFLDSFFYGFDYAILHAIHQFAIATGGVFDWFFTAVTHLADDGLGMIALGLLLLAFKRTRKMGFAVLFAVAVGALITNITLKPLIQRARPYTHEAYEAWWRVMGAHVESDRSFPSGHTTSAMAAMMGVFLAGKRKYSWTALLFALLMGFTRLYLVVHYPSDVLGGLLAGALGGLGGYLIVCLLYRFMQAKAQCEGEAFAGLVSRGCRLVLELDAVCLVRRLLHRKCDNAPLQEPAESTQAPQDAADLAESECADQTTPE